MTKQKTKKKEEQKEKKEKVYDLTGEPVNKLYKTPEFLEKLDEFYDTYGTYKLVAKKLNEEFDCNIAQVTVSKIYKKSIAIKMADEDGSKFFENSFVRMQKRWEESWEMIGDLVSEYKKFRKIIKEKSEDSLTQALTFLKMAPQIISITDAIRKQLEFISKQQEEIRVYQQNNLIISPIQINKGVKDLLPKMTNKELKEFFKTSNDKRLIEFAKEL